MAQQNSWWQKFQALLDERGLRSEADLTRLTRFIHFWVLLGKSFVRNRCPIRASALSYTTLLAMIPMLAVAISVASSLLKDQGEAGIYKLVEQVVDYVMPPTGNPAVAPPSTGEANVAAAVRNPLNLVPTNAPAETNQPATAAAITDPPASAHDDPVANAKRDLTKNIHEFISKTRSSVLGVTGVIALVLVGIRMLGSIESTFNDIWGVTRGRNWVSRIEIYCTALVFGPVMIAGLIALAGGRHFQATREIVVNMPFVGDYVFPALTLIVLWVTFAMFYMLVPNTKVQFNAALIGGVVAGSLWHLNNVFGYLFASGVVKNSIIFGPLFILPVFMAGLYLTWLILLFGAQVAYAFQNRTLYLQEKIAENVNQRGREFVALRLLTCIGQRFQHGLPPATIQQMSAELAIPSRLVQQVLQTLIAAHLVAETHGVEPAYAPARPLENINAHHILQAMRATNGQDLVTRDEPIRAEVYGEFARIQEAEKTAAAAVTMLALVSRAQARQELAALPAAGDEIKLKPALVPDIEPAAQASATIVEPLSTPNQHVADPAPEEMKPVHQSPLFAAEDQPAPSVETEKTTAPTHPTVAIPRDEEREFPL